MWSIRFIRNKYLKKQWDQPKKHHIIYNLYQGYRDTVDL